MDDFFLSSSSGFSDYSLSAIKQEKKLSEVKDIDIRSFSSPSQLYRSFAPEIKVSQPPVQNRTEYFSSFFCQPHLAPSHVFVRMQEALTVVAALPGWVVDWELSPDDAWRVDGVAYFHEESIPFVLSVFYINHVNINSSHPDSLLAELRPLSTSSSVSFSMLFHTFAAECQSVVLLTQEHVQLGLGFSAGLVDSDEFDSFEQNGCQYPLHDTRTCSQCQPFATLPFPVICSVFRLVLSAQESQSLRQALSILARVSGSEANCQTMAELQARSSRTYQTGIGEGDVVSTLSHALALALSTNDIDAARLVCVTLKRISARTLSSLHFALSTCQPLLATVRSWMARPLQLATRELRRNLVEALDNFALSHPQLIGQIIPLVPPCRSLETHRPALGEDGVSLVESRNELGRTRHEGIRAFQALNSLSISAEILCKPPGISTPEPTCSTLKSSRDSSAATIAAVWGANSLPNKPSWNNKATGSISNSLHQAQHESTFDDCFF
jgi:hypothetical protein